MSRRVCPFCGLTVDTMDPAVWRQITVWVHGPKANGACMQGDDTLAWAHDACCRLERRGISAHQQSLL